MVDVEETASVAEVVVAVHEALQADYLQMAEVVGQTAHLTLQRLDKQTQAEVVEVGILLHCQATVAQVS